MSEEYCPNNCGGCACHINAPCSHCVEHNAEGTIARLEDEVVRLKALASERHTLRTEVAALTLALAESREALKSAVCLISHSAMGPKWRTEAPVTYGQIRKAINEESFFGVTAPTPPQGGV